MRLAVVAVFLLFAAGCGGSEQKPLIAASKEAVVRGSLTPNVHLFGEPVVARVDVVVDRDKVDPGDLRLRTDFAPYETIGETSVERQDLGRYTHLRYTTTLRCLNEDCIPRTIRNSEVMISQTPELPLFPENQQRDDKRRYDFPPGIVSTGVGSDARTLGRAVWPPLRSVSRINWFDPNVVGQGFPFESNVTPLPEPSYRVSPTLLGVGLLLLASALLALPAWLLWDRRRRRVSPAADRGASLSPLERALVLVEWASRRPSVGERREALEVLAVELDGKEGAERADGVREQGWSPPSPAPEEMTELVASIRAGDAPAT
jgi:hypothetical protein